MAMSCVPGVEGGTGRLWPALQHNLSAQWETPPFTTPTHPSHPRRIGEAAHTTSDLRQRQECAQQRGTAQLWTGVGRRGSEDAVTSMWKLGDGNGGRCIARAIRIQPAITTCDYAAHPERRP